MTEVDISDSGSDCGDENHPKSKVKVKRGGANIDKMWPKKNINSKQQLLSKSVSPMRSIGGQSPSRPDEAKTTTKKEKKFNPEVFKFKSGDYNTKQEMFRNSFYEHGQANKHKIN